MRAFTWDTLHRALRAPGTWVLLGLGLLAGWFGLHVAILALGDPGRQTAEILIGTTQALAVVGVLWILARTLEEDHHSGFRVAADCTAPGRAGRLLGRWAGASLVGVALASVAQLLLGVGLPRSAALGTVPAEAGLYLLLTNTLLAGLVGAWGALAAAIWRGAPAILAGLILWLVGHLPWGGPGLFEGRAGRAVAAVLPGPRDPTLAVVTLPSAVLVIGGLLLLALAIASRPRGRQTDPARRSPNRGHAAPTPG